MVGHFQGCQAVLPAVGQEMGVQEARIGERLLALHAGHGLVLRAVFGHDMPFQVCGPVVGGWALSAVVSPYRGVDHRVLFQVARLRERGWTLLALVGL